MSRLVWTLPALAAVTLLTSGVEAQNNEERAVIAAAQAVFDAMEALDPEAFRNAMVPDGFLMAVRSETTRRTTRDDFAANIARQTRPMIERMVVVLPMPFRPMRHIRDPRGTSMSMSQRIWLPP